MTSTSSTTRSTANEPVKAHLRTIAFDAQTRLLSHLISIQTGQGLTDVPLEPINQGYKRSNDKLALACETIKLLLNRLFLNSILLDERERGR